MGKFNTKTKSANPVVRDVAQLMVTLRNADGATLIEAQDILKEFSDSWLASGESKNLAGAGQCCLTDTDLVTALEPVLEIWIDTQQ